MIHGYRPYMLDLRPVHVRVVVRLPNNDTHVFAAKLHTDKHHGCSKPTIEELAVTGVMEEYAGKMVWWSPTSIVRATIFWPLYEGDTGSDATD